MAPRFNPDQPVPYDDIDPPVHSLVRVLNEFPGIYTITACGGHEGPDAYRPADRWTVGFVLEPVDPAAEIFVPTENAMLSLELLAWVNYDAGNAGDAWLLEPIAKPPWLNFPGQMLQFRIEGRRGDDGLEPDDLAAHLNQILEELYVPLDQLEGDGDV